jgi:hypothetical protein
MKYLLYLTVLLSAPSSIFAQEITGVWKGTLQNESTSQSFQYEIVISKTNGKYSAMSYTWKQDKENKYYDIKKIRVRVAKDGKVIMQDAEMVENNYPTQPNKNIYQLNVLDLVNNDNGSALEGLFVTNRTKEFHEHTGKISMKRVSTVVENDLASNFKINPAENTLTATVR